MRLNSLQLLSFSSCLCSRYYRTRFDNAHLFLWTRPNLEVVRGDGSGAKGGQQDLGEDMRRLSLECLLGSVWAKVGEQESSGSGDGVSHIGAAIDHHVGLTQKSNAHHRHEETKLFSERISEIHLPEHLGGGQKLDAKKAHAHSICLFFHKVYRYCTSKAVRMYVGWRSSKEKTVEERSEFFSTINLLWL